MRTQGSDFPGKDRRRRQSNGFELNLEDHISQHKTLHQMKSDRTLK